MLEDQAQHGEKVGDHVAVHKSVAGAFSSFRCDAMTCRGFGCKADTHKRQRIAGMPFSRRLQLSLTNGAEAIIETRFLGRPDFMRAAIANRHYASGTDNGTATAVACAPADQAHSLVSTFRYNGQFFEHQKVSTRVDPWSFY